MADYQSRRWLAWQHHMVLVGVAMVFTLGERELLQKDAPILSVRDIVDMIARYFESGRTEAEVESAVRDRHRRRIRAMKSKMRGKSGDSGFLTK